MSAPDWWTAPLPVGWGRNPGTNPDPTWSVTAVFSMLLGFVLVIWQRGKSLEGSMGGLARPGLEGRGWGYTALALPSLW